MGKIENAVSWAKQIANDNRHGYSQASRWGPDYDCSSLVIAAWEQAGVPVKAAGASYTGNMRGSFLRCGFVDVTTQVGLQSGYGLQPGDVLLNYQNHTCLYIGNNQVVNARTSEGNSQSGDQSGNEIRIQSYWNFPWNCVLRFKEPAGSSPPETDSVPDAPVSGSDTGAVYSGSEYKLSLRTLKRGDKGVRVERLQQILIARGYYCGGRCYSGRETADGDFGAATEVAVKDVQLAAKISQDGIAGAETMTVLLTT